MQEGMSLLDLGLSFFDFTGPGGDRAGPQRQEGGAYVAAEPSCETLRWPESRKARGETP